MSSKIHPTAIVDAKAEIGHEVEIGAFSVIGPHVRIGAKCRIGSHVVIDGHTILGEENVIYQFASLGAAPQDLKFKGESSTLVLGNRNVVREYVTLQPGTEHGRMSTRIGDANLFMACSHVAHDCIVGSSNVFANSCALAGHVTIGNRVVLGGMTGVHQFCRVGDFAMLGAGSMVDLDIPPYCIGQGDRCRLRGINVIGLKRGGFEEADVRAVRQAYRHIFIRREGKLHERIASLPEGLTARPAIVAFVDFLNASERGFALSGRGSAAEEAK